jgi:hypothetical protein
LKKPSSKKGFSSPPTNFPEQITKIHQTSSPPANFFTSRELFRQHPCFCCFLPLQIISHSKSFTPQLWLKKHLYNTIEKILKWSNDKSHQSTTH